MVIGETETFNSAAPVHTKKENLEADYIPLITADGDHFKTNDLPKSVLDYYLSIEKVLEKEDFDNESERKLLEEKLLDQLKVDGLTKIIFHWDGSRVVERLLVNCHVLTLLEMAQLMVPQTVELACHNFASHVLELFLMRLVTFVYTHSHENKDLLTVTEEVFRKLCVGIPELVSNIHGSYSLRLALQVLIGVKVEDENKKKKRWEIGKGSFYNIEEKGRTIHPTLKRILHKFTKRLMREDVSVMVRSDQGSPLLGVLLILLQKTENKSLSQLKGVLLAQFEEKENDYSGVEKFGPLPAVLLHAKASYVIQSLIKICSKEELEDLYSTHYKTVLIPLSLHSVANYTIQTLLDHCPTRDMADDMCSQLLPLFEDLLAESITGVVISVIKSCHHYALTSHDIRKVLREAFHVPDDKKDMMFRCVMSLTTFDVLCEKMESYKKPTQSGKPRRDRFEATLTGSLMIQGLFKLGEIGDLEEGICSLSEDHMVYLGTNVHSSYAIQSFLSSLTIPATSKHRFIKRAVFVVDKLVVNPYGSRIVEAMWTASDNQLKSSIAQVLIDKEQQIKDNSYGKIVWRNCNLKSFKLGLQTWEKDEKKKKRKLEEFDKIINSTENNNTVKSGNLSDNLKIGNSSVSSSPAKKKNKSSDETTKKKKKKKVKKER